MLGAVDSDFRWLSAAFMTFGFQAHRSIITHSNLQKKYHFLAQTWASGGQTRLSLQEQKSEIVEQCFFDAESSI